MSGGRLFRFQSSPAPKGRCNVRRGGVFPAGAGFNPHRPRRADATKITVNDRSQGKVSILTGPEGPMQLYETEQENLQEVVSILTGPEGPMQRPTGCSNSAKLRFQSSPAPKGRCNHRLRPCRRGQCVSILTGPEGPMQPPPPLPGCRRPRFNPHRPRRADATKRT